MEIALGILRWSPTDLWEATFFEVTSAIAGYQKINTKESTSRVQDLAEIANQFPTKVGSAVKEKTHGRRR